MASTLHVSIAPEPIAQVGDWLITNSTFTTFIVTAIVILGARYVGNKAKTTPDSHLYQVFEIIYNFWEDLGRSVIGNRSRQYMPIIISLFFFILISNWSGLIPGVGSISVPLYHPEEAASDDHAFAGAVYAADPIPEDADIELERPEELDPNQNVVTDDYPEEEHAEVIPLLRAPTADLNTTFALAIISVLYTQYVGFKTLGVGQHVGKFLNFSNPINFFVGILELISEFAKIVSFSFRLFGNIFAGEVLLAVVAFLTFKLATLPVLPFIGLELFVGFIQAFVFAILTLIFLSQAVESHEHH